MEASNYSLNGNGKSHSKLGLDSGTVAACRDAAAEIAAGVADEISGKTTVSIERTVLRLLGLDGADDSDIPLANGVVDHVLAEEKLGHGVGYWAANALLQTDLELEEIAQATVAGDLDLCELPLAEEETIHRHLLGICEERIGRISAAMEARRDWREELGENPPPQRYVLTATGNVYEDVTHARAVADHGGDIVAVIRSTAQSLLDYVPHG